MARAQGANAQLLFGFSSAYGGTPVAGDEWHRVPFVDCELGDSQPLEPSDVLGQGRDPRAPSRGVITNGGSVTIPADQRFIGLWLKACFGAPSTAGGVHTFASGAQTLPDFCAEVGFTDLGKYYPNPGCMVDSLKFAWSGAAGKSNVVATVVGQGEGPGALAQIAAAPTEFTFDRFSNFQGEIKRGGVVLGNVVSAEITYANNLDPVRVIRRDGKIAAVDPSIASAIGKIVCRFDENAPLDAATDGTPLALSLAFEASAGAYFRFAMPAVHLPKVKLPIKGPGGVEASFDFQASRASAGGAPFVTVTLANDVAGY